MDKNDERFWDPCKARISDNCVMIAGKCRDHDNS